ncbi:hypothetical protein GPECTOR_2g1397 [Gonium pectorale]|uniref:Uncharacterized protein n=1 Tax=Gonium pectorale TaxID=33097 RepID=A0A150H104_GONPE|nr:hypothetical protein GPECTOR_2g1397 [Gonium pectorale]|eukprot:KXZ55846.1 hypothetical protein GPECTOR_2g1397 [Gonium pectorale]
MLMSIRKRLACAEEGGDDYFPAVRVGLALTPAGLAFRRANHDLLKFLAADGRRPSWSGTYLMAEEPKGSNKWVRQDLTALRAQMDAASQGVSKQCDSEDA